MSKETGILPREGEEEAPGVSVIRLEATFHKRLNARFQQVPTASPGPCRVPRALMLWLGSPDSRRGNEGRQHYSGLAPNRETEAQRGQHVT